MTMPTIEGKKELSECTVINQFLQINYW